MYIVDIYSSKNEQLKLHRSLLGVKGGGGKNSALNMPSLQHYIAVTEKVNIFRSNLYLKYDKHNKYPSKMYIKYNKIFSISFLKL